MKLYWSKDKQVDRMICRELAHSKQSVECLTRVSNVQKRLEGVKVKKYAWVQKTSRVSPAAGSCIYML